MFVALELVEAGAGGGEKDDVAWLGGGGGQVDCSFEGLGGGDFGGLLDLTGDLSRGGTDRVDALHALVQEGIEDGVVTAFVLSAENEVDIGRKAFQSLDGGVDVGGFGVVEVTDAGDFGDEFEAVLDSFESADSVTDFFGGASGQTGHANSGQDVFQVMRALESDFGHWKNFDGKDFAFALIVAEEDLAVADEGSGRDFAEAAEVQDRALGATGERVCRGIVSAEDAE